MSGTVVSDGKDVVEPIQWIGDALRFLDQRHLPGKTLYVESRDYREVIHAIRSLSIRGAPLIGIAAAYGIALAARHEPSTTLSSFKIRLLDIADEFASSRPTALELFTVIDAARKIINTGKSIPSIIRELRSFAVAVHKNDADRCTAIAERGKVLFREGGNILTHCNTGRLATGGGGTALNIIVQAYRSFGNIHVFVDETRPLLQGSRLTAWELKQYGIPFTILTDSAAAYLMKSVPIRAVLVGADRIAMNGDTANKIGTYAVALAAYLHGIPFYVAAPTSTIDPCLENGDDIPIEARTPEEILLWNGSPIAPKDSSVFAPAFDITPHGYITAIITERGIFSTPFEKSLADMLHD